MRLGEAPRWGLAFVGLPLWLTLSLLPTLSGGADYEYHCRERRLAGDLGDCIQDGLPALELMAPLAALVFAYPFLRFAFSLYAPAPAERRFRWRLATRSDPGDLWPTLHIFGLLGAAWSAWRLLSYPFEPQFLAFQIVWATFGFWCIGGVLAALADPVSDPGQSEPPADAAPSRPTMEAFPIAPSAHPSAGAAPASAPDPSRPAS